VFSIDCYECTSVNGDNRLCDDKFRRDLTTAMFISRKCDFGYFKGTHCIKLKGRRADGTDITIRQCGDYDWGRHCGDIKYMIDQATETTENIDGCLEACDTDGCNRASSHDQFSRILTAIFIPCVLIWIQH
ncbi:hypothetical protein FSP39_022341, partial [Pinctada imbricata]